MNYSQKRINSLQLIELVRQNDILYNFKHPEFHDYGQKETIWAGIDARLSQQDGESKRKWTMLRDAYRRNLRNRRDNPNRKPFKFSRQMAFIRPHFVKQPDNFEQDGDKEVPYNSFQNTDSTHAPGDVQVDADTFAECLLINELDDHEKSRLISENHMSTDGGYKQTEFTASPIQQTSFEISGKKQDLIDVFLLGIGATLRSFNPYHLNVAKQKIFNIVSDLEMEQIKGRQAMSAVVRLAPSSISTPKRKPSAVRTTDDCTHSSKRSKHQEKEDTDKTSDVEHQTEIELSVDQIIEDTITEDTIINEDQ
ncbi:uncharacterized protein LOC111049004 [Nilaparvata lugens]|uniref:uncharacterized protein LOC111049004 n=1 Tax=Nilaparvata lugens TaxID=108931 RepID=UPI000B9863CD|nr:uncharacterized protein LOC111049004 [Nilaparvata lugens]